MMPFRAKAAAILLALITALILLLFSLASRRGGSVMIKCPV